MFRPVYTRNDVGGGDHLPRQAPSSSGLGLRPFTPATRVRVPSGSLNKSALGRNRLQSATKPVCGQALRFALASRCGRERAPAAPLASWRRGNGRRPLLVRGHNRHGRQAHSTGLRADEHVGQLCRRADSGSHGQVLRGTNDWILILFAAIYLAEADCRAFVNPNKSIAEVNSTHD